MDHEIEVLVGLAEALLREVTELESHIGGEADTGLSADQLSSVRGVLGSACQHLTVLTDLLGKANGSLARLVDRFDGASVLISAADAAQRFLDAHRDFLRRVRLPQKTVESLIRGLKEHIDDGTIRLDEGATLSNGDHQTILEQLRMLRDLVCEIHENAELLAQIWDRELIKACIQGIKGACIIALDVAGAATAPHITVFVLVSAVRSVWSGYRRVQSSVESIRSRWRNLTGAATEKIRRESLEQHALALGSLKTGKKE